MSETPAHTRKVLETAKTLPEEFGASSEWCSQAKNKLSKGKLYLKTKYHEHCQKHGSECPDHCKSFALSDSTDAKFKKECNRHNRACSDCEAIKDTIDEVISSIARYSSKMNKEQEGDLQYDARAAAAKIFEWKAHIIRALNQEQCKQDTVKCLQADEMFVYRKNSKPILFAAIKQVGI